MKVLLGMVLGVAILAAGAFLYFRLGLAPVATASAPMPFEQFLAEGALHARITKEAPAIAPIQADESVLAAGVKTYRESCAVCHGLRGEEETGIAMGMFPKPPKLLEGTGVTDDEPGETYWKVANGIRLTGMPGFGASMSDEQIWQVSLMMEQRDKLPDGLERMLSEPAAGPKR